MLEMLEKKSESSTISCPEVRIDMRDTLDSELPFEPDAPDKNKSSAMFFVWITVAIYLTVTIVWMLNVPSPVTAVQDSTPKRAPTPKRVPSWVTETARSPSDFEQDGMLSNILDKKITGLALFRHPTAVHNTPCVRACMSLGAWKLCKKLEHHGIILEVAEEETKTEYVSFQFNENFRNQGGIAVNRMMDPTKWNLPEARLVFRPPTQNEDVTLRDLCRRFSPKRWLLPIFGHKEYNCQMLSSDIYDNFFVEKLDADTFPEVDEDLFDASVIESALMKDVAERPYLNRTITALRNFDFRCNDVLQWVWRCITFIPRRIWGWFS